MRTRLILTIALAAFVINGATAYAVDPDPGTYRSATASGQWDTAANWEVDDGGWRAADDYPRAGDTATILEDDLIYVSSSTQEAANLTVNKKVSGSSPAILEMRSAAVLKLRDTLTVQVDGSVAANTAIFRFYADDGETQPILRTTASLEISGPITVEDPADSDGCAGGKIDANTAADWVILMSDGTITAQYGPLDITCDIEVDGTILANASATAWRIRFTKEILGGSTGLIEASDSSNARVHFDDGSAFNNAIDLKVDDGARMQFSDTDDYVTSGGFSMPSGFFDIDLDVSVKSTGSYTH